MLRITSTGGIPTDNPFFNQTTGDNRAIWALGVRNPVTFSFQRTTGRMFINDVGQNTCGPSYFSLKLGIRRNLDASKTEHYDFITLRHSCKKEPDI